MLCLPFCLPKLAITRRTIAFSSHLHSNGSLECQSNPNCQNLFAAEVGVTVTMAACAKNVSVVKKAALWDNTSTSRRALKVK